MKRSAASARNWASRWIRCGLLWGRPERTTPGCWATCGLLRGITEAPGTIEMKIPINLASQPFRRDRAMVAASLAVSALLVFTLGVLISLALSDRSQSKDVRSEISRLNNDIRKIS